MPLDDAIDWNVMGKCLERLMRLETEIERLRVDNEKYKKWCRELIDGIDFTPEKHAIIEDCARVAELFSINKTSIHPGLTWDQMSEQAKAICHTTCQQLAVAIRALRG